MVANLMKAFIEFEELNSMLQCIQEVANFKSFVNEYIRDGLAKLISLEDMHLLKFYVDDKRW